MIQKWFLCLVFSVLYHDTRGKPTLSSHLVHEPPVASYSSHSVTVPVYDELAQGFTFKGPDLHREDLLGGTSPTSRRYNLEIQNEVSDSGKGNGVGLEAHRPEPKASMDEVARQALNELPPQVARFIAQHSALFNGKNRDKIRPFSEESRYWWNNIRKDWDLISFDDRSAAEDWILSYASPSTKPEDLRKSLYAFYYNMARVRQGLPGWWSSDAIKQWTDSGLDWVATATLGDFLGFGKPEGLSRSFINHRLGAFSALVKNAQWHVPTPSWFENFRGVPAVPLSQSAEIKVLQAFNAKSYEIGMWRYIARLSEKIKTLEATPLKSTKEEILLFKDGLNSARQLVILPVSSSTKDTGTLAPHPVLESSGAHGEVQEEQYSKASPQRPPAAATRQMIETESPYYPNAFTKKGNGILGLKEQPLAESAASGSINKRIHPNLRKVAVPVTHRVFHYHSVSTES